MRLAIIVLGLSALCPSAGAQSPVPPRATAAESVAFFESSPGDYDYGLQLDVPPTFGRGELTLELWIRPDASFPIGSTASGANQRTHWSSADEIPYSSCCWWFEGNFLLDGHNNVTFANGTFSLQFYGGGRLRWLFGDGEVAAGQGGLWSIGAFPASTTPSLLDGRWHRIDLVRRWSGATAADLELWIDGVLIAVETTTARVDMRTWWDSWSGFPSGQEGWFWGVEKQAAIGVLSQYEDYKGPIDSVRFFDRALTPDELALGGCQIADGLVAQFALDEGSGTTTCDALTPARCWTLIGTSSSAWSTDGHPACSAIFFDGFESGGFEAWDSQQSAPWRPVEAPGRTW